MKLLSGESVESINRKTAHVVNCASEFFTALVNPAAGRTAAVSAVVIFIALLSTQCIAQTATPAASETPGNTGRIVIANETSEASGTMPDTDVESTGTEAAETDNLHVVLLGETAGESADTPAGETGSNVAGIATTTLGGRVTDLTTVGLTMEALADKVRQEVTWSADIAVVFTGLTDDEAGTDEARQRQALQQIISSLRSKNSSMQIFLVPAAPEVGAITSANMRLAATEANATFVPIGTEVGGQPYVDALKEVKAELAVSTEASNERTVTPEHSSTVVIQGGQLREDVEVVPSEVEMYEDKKANLQQELERVAGQAGEALATLPSLEDTATTGFVDSASTGTAGTVMKRGPEAKDENIRMRSLPAVKAFRPKIPVPRNDVDVKEPALSR